jgi:hypothetical protein
MYNQVSWYASWCIMDFKQTNGTYLHFGNPLQFLLSECVSWLQSLAVRQTWYTTIMTTNLIVHAVLVDYKSKLWKEVLNSWWSRILPISTKQTTTSSHWMQKKTTTYADVMYIVYLNEQDWLSFS